ncbi:ribokinase [uncultured Metabacillus sp.]|uniref:ribokinase n=1 Tax=uncultured Metabacillus sp. TaxID=2860135 RepID=UPI0026277DAA|nr:ribokinase [uncultured Metabacillus sp.]
MQKNAVTIVGSINYDIILKQKRLPEIGETFSAESVTFCGGGKGANQAVQCAKLGLESYIVGKIGNDHFGTELLANMEKYGLNIDYVSQADTNTGLGVVNTISDGKLVATIAKGANYRLTFEDIDNAHSLFEKSKIVILQLEIPKQVVEYTIKKAKETNCYVILNAAPASELDVEYLKMVDCLVVNETEASFYAGERVSTVEEAEKVCKKLFLYPNHLLIITLGEKGSILFDGTKTIHIPCRTVDVVETTGAGDSYIGALTYGLINDLSLEKLGELATIVSSRTVTKIGAQDAMPTLFELNEYV